MNILYLFTIIYKYGHRGQGLGGETIVKY